MIIAWANEDNDQRPSTSDLIYLLEGKESLSAVAAFDVTSATASVYQTLEKYFYEESVVGVKLYTGYQHFYPNDERCQPIYKLCIKYDKPVIFHSGDTLAGVVPNPKLKYSHPLNIDDVAADLPELKIVIAHLGNPWLVDCAEVLYKNPNVYADISGLVVGADLENPYRDMMRGKIRDIINYAGVEHKLMYGTDWPLAPMETYIKFAKSLELDDVGTEALFSGNAIKVFGLDV